MWFRPWPCPGCWLKIVPYDRALTFEPEAVPYPVHRSSWSQMGQGAASWIADQAAQSQAIMGIALVRHMENMTISFRVRR